MPILHLHDCPVQAWKNGLGRTRELAVEPPGAGMEDFLWRASIAEVDSAAPFSAFPGVDRSIVLIEGAGFHMRLDDGRSHDLTEPFAPFVFSGEAKVAVTLAGGPTRDFNLMTRRGRARGRITAWRTPANAAIHADTVLVYVARGTLALDGELLQAGDIWRRQNESPSHVALAPQGVALAVQVHRLN
jgi:hypothetical protein